MGRVCLRGYIKSAQPIIVERITLILRAIFVPHCLPLLVRPLRVPLLQGATPPPRLSVRALGHASANARAGEGGVVGGAAVVVDQPVFGGVVGVGFVAGRRGAVCRSLVV